MLWIFYIRFLAVNRWSGQCHWTLGLSCEIDANTTDLPSRVGKVWASVQWIYNTRNESIAWAKSYKVRFAVKNWYAQKLLHFINYINVVLFFNTFEIYFIVIL